MSLVMPVPLCHVAVNVGHMHVQSPLSLASIVSLTLLTWADMTAMFATISVTDTVDAARSSRPCRWCTCSPVIHPLCLVPNEPPLSYFRYALRRDVCRAPADGENSQIVLENCQRDARALAFADFFLANIAPVP